MILHLGSEPADFSPADFLPDRHGEVLHASQWQAESGEPILIIRTSAAGDYWLHYEEGTDVFANAAIDQLWVTWRADSCLEDASTFLMGSVMAILAQFRGSVCLHGCSIVIDNAIVGLLGPQGAGKSTSAAAFASAGYPVAGDDLILLSEKDGQFFVTPAYPMIRLWPASVESLFGHEDALPRITEGWDKRWLNLNSGEFRFQTETLPLSALYILGPRSSEESAPHIAALPPAAALLQVIGNSWAHYFEKPVFLAHQLRFLTRLSQQTPIRSLCAHEDAARLPELVSRLTTDVRARDGASN